MAVILNPEAIGKMFVTPGEPIPEFVRLQGERVAAIARMNINAYYHTASALAVDQDVGVEMEGGNAIVGIRDKGSKSKNLAHKQATGEINWLKGALDSVRL